MSDKVVTPPGVGMYELHRFGTVDSTQAVEAKSLTDVARVLQSLIDTVENDLYETYYGTQTPSTGDVIVDPMGQRWAVEVQGFSSLDHPGLRLDGPRHCPSPYEEIDPEAFVPTQPPKERER